MLIERVNGRLHEIFEWCKCNELSLNPEKSEFLNVANKVVARRLQVFIGADPIKQIESFKYLGIHVDARLDLIVQINHLKGKLSQLCGFSFRISKFLEFQSAKNMYNLCVHSVLLYWTGVVSLSAHLAVMI